MNQAPDPDMAAPRPRGAIGRPPPVVPMPDIDISADDNQPSRWEIARQERLNSETLPIAPQILPQPDEAVQTVEAAPQPESTLPLIAPATLAELEPLLDEAAAALDREAMVALLSRLGALDRALANGQYNAVLCQMGAARRIAR